MVASASLDLASPASLMRSLGLEPRPVQEAFLAEAGPRACFSAGRGAGKTTAGLVLALHAALCGAGRRVLVVAPSPDVVWLYGRAVEMCRRSGCGFFCRRSRAMLSFENGSTIQLLVAAGDPEGFRGYRPDLVVVDQAEKVPVAVKEALAGLIRPGSRLVALEDV